MSNAFYTMKKVTDKTGLNHHVIRVWEKRYNAVTPKRTETNRRLYSEQDVTKLEFLKLLTENGYPISQIANKEVSDLSQLIVNENLESITTPKVGISKSLSPDEILYESINLLKEFKTKELETLLLNETVNFSQFSYITKILEPLLIEVGKNWAYGSLRVSHEHLISAVTKMILMNFKNSNTILNQNKTVIFTTPNGQLHELGALMGSVIASSFGINAIYLGPNLPVEEIVFAIHENKAKYVVLSLIYPLDDESLNEQLLRMKSLIKNNAEIILTCKDAGIYKNTIKMINAKLISTFDDFNTYIQTI